MKLTKVVAVGALVAGITVLCSATPADAPKVMGPADDCYGPITLFEMEPVSDCSGPVVLFEQEPASGCYGPVLLNPRANGVVIY